MVHVETVVVEREGLAVAILDGGGGGPTCRSAAVTVARAVSVHSRDGVRATANVKNVARAEGAQSFRHGQPGVAVGAVTRGVVAGGFDVVCRGISPDSIQQDGKDK